MDNMKSSSNFSTLRSSITYVHGVESLFIFKKKMSFLPIWLITFCKTIFCFDILVFRQFFSFVLCVCFTFFIIPLPSRGGGIQALSSACKTAQTDFTDWMPFLPSNLMEEISSNTEALRANI